MALNIIGRPTGAGGDATPSTPTDPVEANALTLTTGEWEDVFAIDGTGTALAVIESAGDGLHFGPGAASSRYGARLAGTLGAGDQLIAFTFAMGRRTDIATSLQIAAKVGISPGGLDDPQNAEWYAAGIDGIARDIYGSALTAWKNGSLTTAWTAETKGATRTFAGGISGTFAIERTGTDITIWLIRAGVRQQIETYAGAAITAGDVFVHIESPSSGSHMVLLALATSGLAWDGERLVAA